MNADADLAKSVATLRAKEAQTQRNFTEWKTRSHAVLDRANIERGGTLEERILRLVADRNRYRRIAAAPGPVRYRIGAWIHAIAAWIEGDP